MGEWSHGFGCEVDRALGVVVHSQALRRRSLWKERMMNKWMFLVAMAMSAFFSTAQSAGAEDMKGMTMKPATSPADKAFAASMKTMMNGMNVKPTGKPDADFARMMIPHHQGAIDMAKIELQYGTDPELRQLSTDIVAAQEKEIAQMRAWLAKNGR
jgi:uncharacterized protein (DUF305 family)